MDQGEKQKNPSGSSRWGFTVTNNHLTEQIEFLLPYLNAYTKYFSFVFELIKTRKRNGRYSIAIDLILLGFSLKDASLSYL
jgi:hypothetical protein